MERPMRIRKFLPACILVCGALPVFAAAGGQQQMQQQQMTMPAPPTVAAGQRITIGPNDVLSVQVFDTPELSSDSVQVSQSGQINLPVLGLVTVGGMTPIQAAVQIESELRSHGLMLNPHVTVSVVEYASESATVLGEVRSPGVYSVFGDRRLLDVIALAGGLSPAAGKVVIIAHRGDPHHPAVIRLVENARSLGAQRNPIIRPDDTIEVGKAGIIYILGDVKKPGGFLIDNNEHISLMEALSLAGGWDQTAALSKARLIRKVPQGHEQMILDLKHVLRGRQADVSVKNGDILYIPSSLGKTLAYRGMEAVIAAAQSVVVYGYANGNF